MTVCDVDNCAGCMLCLDVCKKNAISVIDGGDAFNAVIDNEKCVGCNACHNKCPQNNTPIKQTPIEWYEGWNTEEIIRTNAPSGGIGMALAKRFITDGGKVCSCRFIDGEFRFVITDVWDEALKFSGSKYVKSNPKGIYNQILDLLKSGEKILFIGLPCQVAALKNFVGDKYIENLVLVDLICHGSPSSKMLEQFLNQYSKSLTKIKDIKFRLKTKYQVVVDGKSIICEGVSDKYSIAFTNGLTCTNNCYSCHYADEYRVSDITIGDSWGTALENVEKIKGVSLILCQTNKGKDLLSKANIRLLKADREKAIETNSQLVNPMEKPKGRSRFFELLHTKKFNNLVFNIYRKQCIKQDIKLILIKLHLVH